MPKAYEAMRNKFKASGMSDAAAKTKAAKIYNSKHPKAPVTGKHEASVALRIQARMK